MIQWKRAAAVGLLISGFFAAVAGIAASGASEGTGVLLCIVGGIAVGYLISETWP